jgi:hypothetical protein
MSKKSSHHYFGLNIFDLEDVIVKNKASILCKKPLKEHFAKRSQPNKMHPKEMFEQCELCEKWIKVSKGSFGKDENGKLYYWSPLMGALDHSNRWVCSTCWDIIDVACYGPYLRASRPAKYESNPAYVEALEKMPNEICLKEDE